MSVGFDRFGSSLRRPDPMVDYVDLTTLSIKFIPATHPAGIHFHREPDGSIISTPFTTKCTRVVGVQGVERYLAQPGIHLLLYVHTRKDNRLTWVRSHCFRPGTAQADQSYGAPMSMSGWLALWGSLCESGDYLLPKRPDLSRFPHLCPRCGSAAYVGLNEVDCSEGCR